jgi:hypothetical protein
MFGTKKSIFWSDSVVVSSISVVPSNQATMNMFAFGEMDKMHNATFRGCLHVRFWVQIAVQFCGRCGLQFNFELTSPDMC